MRYSKTRQQGLFQYFSVRKPLFLLPIVFSALLGGNAQAEWVKQSGLTITPLNTVAVDPVDSDKIFVGTGDIQSNGVAGLYKSTGILVQKEWSTSVTGNIRSIAIAPDSTATNQKMFVSAISHGILKSLDGGLTWLNSQIAYPPNQVTQADLTDNVAQLAISKRANNLQNIYALVDTADNSFPDSAGIYVSATDGASWTKLNSIADAKKIAVVPDQPNTLYASTILGELKKSTDGGNNFFPVSSGLPQAGTGALIADFAIDPINPLNMYTSVFQAGVPSVSGLYYSADAGQSWTLKSPDVFYHLTVEASSTVSNKVYGIRNANALNPNGTPFHNVFVSENHGANWVTLDPQNTGLTGQNMNAITVQNSIVYVAAADGLYTYNNSAVATTNPLASNFNLNIPFGSVAPATGILQGVKVTPATDVLTFQLVNNGTKGTAQIAASGSFTYTPFANQTGTDIVTFKVTDQVGRQSLVNGQINISFNATAATTPVPLNSVETMAIGSTTLIGLLSTQKVTPTDTLTYSVVNPTTIRGNFQFTNASTGSYSYTAPINQTGTDTITFSVRDQLGRTSANNGVLTINLPGTTGGGSTTAIDLTITATATPASIQAGSDITYNLIARNLSSTSNSGAVTITSSTLPAGVTLVKPGTFDTCNILGNNTMSCSVSTLRSGLSQTIPVILRTPATLAVTNITVTFSISTQSEVNTANNSSLAVSTAVSAAGGSGLTAPVAQNTPWTVTLGQTVLPSSSLSVTKVNTATDTLRYVYMSSGTTKGTFNFTVSGSQTNESTSPTFRYTPPANAVAGGTDQIQFKAIDQLGRESNIGVITITFQAPNNSASGSATTGGGSSGGSMNPMILSLGLLPLLMRRRKK